MINGRTQWITAVISLVLTAAAVWLGTPRPPSLTDHAVGDGALAAQLRTLTTTGDHQSIAAAVITPDAITHASIGEAIPGSESPTGPNDPIELGSITKTFNGFLLADAVDRGEVTLDDPLSRHLPELVGAPLGDVTLLELASHRGGVPPLPQSVIGGALLFQFTGANPYADATRDAILAEVRTMSSMGERGEVQYSNLGATLLGWALANAARAPDWESLVDQRLLGPIGVEATFAAHPDMIPAGTVPGYTGNGLRPEPWTSPAFRPAGSSTFITPDSVARFAQAILRADVPGMAALEPQFGAGGDERIGLAWFTRTLADGRQLTWHNGGTAGFRTMLVIDRAAERAVFVVANTDGDIDDVAFSLLTGDPPPGRSFSAWLLLIPGLAALAVGAFAWSAIRSGHRLALVSSFATAVVLLALARLLGSWAMVPAVIWSGLVVITAVIAVIAARRWPVLPWHPRRFRVLRWIGAGINVVLAIVAVALTASYGAG